MTQAATTQTDARRLLVEWANDQDQWVRGLVGEVLSFRKPVAEESLDHFYELLLLKKELAEGQQPFFEELEDASGAGPTEEALALTKIVDVENVNALAREQEIQFNSGSPSSSVRTGQGRPATFAS